MIDIDKETCIHCGATLKHDAACASCIKLPVDGSPEEAERTRRYQTLPPRTPNGGIIMPQ